ncbi:MAG: DUF362 domain-containing protein [Sporomusaceae bacterium]|jgi:uncharacterized protein (DUF362 family)|nr:DUF362 domain-containing protein [Sporomusaceae bacterium]
MNRRDFVKYLTYAGLALGTAGCFQEEKAPPPTEPTRAAEPVPPASATNAGSANAAQFVVAEGTDPQTLMAKGLLALGGIEKFVRPGDKVVIKPNFSVPRTVDEAATTNPFLVAALVRECLRVQAKEVKVIDHTLTNGKICLEKSGIYEQVTQAGGKAYVINNQSEEFYQTVAINGVILKNANYAKDVLEADVFINFPILKHHNGTKLTLGLKNLMGLVWDRGFFHRSDLNAAIADLAAFKKPHLTILDAMRGITDNGPMGPGPIKEYNQVIFSTDMLAVDAYAATLFGLSPDSIGYLSAAAKTGLGSLSWQHLEMVRV